MADEGARGGVRFVNEDGTLTTYGLKILNANGARIGSVLSGLAAANAGLTQLASGLSSEETARINGDTNVAGQGDGSAATNSKTYSGVNVTDATWVTAVTVTVTPGGAGGDYTITASPQGFYATGVVGGGSVFNGNWRIREEETGGGTPVELDSGTFTATESPQDWEGGGSSTFTDVVFTGLPSGLIAANYSVQTDITFEMQRASGSTTLTGQAGGMAVAWTA